MRDKAQYYYQRWLIQAPLGLILVGFGACLIAEAAHLKFSNVGWHTWVPAGTVALIVFNAGLCVFGDSILHRIRYERLK